MNECFSIPGHTGFVYYGPGKELTPGGYITPLYGLYRYVRPQRVGFFSRFGHKQGINFGHFAAILVVNRVSIFVYSY